jgi:hypothetical protein
MNVRKLTWKNDFGEMRKRSPERTSSMSSLPWMCSNTGSLTHLVLSVSLASDNQGKKEKRKNHSSKPFRKINNRTYMSHKKK